MKIRTFALAASVCVLSGCASLMGDSTQMLPINSSPSDASIVITDETGAEVFRGSTPATVTLNKSDGSYWGGKDYKVVISKPGYHPQTVPVKASPNAWYLGGNFLFGGLVGWFIVDPLSGKMYTLSPQNVTAALGEDPAHNNLADDGGISVVLLEDVPESLLAHMTPIN